MFCSAVQQSCVVPTPNRPASVNCPAASPQGGGTGISNHWKFAQPQFPIIGSLRDRRAAANFSGGAPRVKIRPNSAESLALVASAIPDLASRLDAYRVLDEPPDEETMQTFEEYLHGLIGELDAALAAGDLAGVAKNAHALKGMGGAAGGRAEKMVPADFGGAMNSASGKAASGGHVLVVEDEAFNRFLLRKIVAGLDCSISECENGSGALTAARERQPDVALVDIQLPDIDGFAVCRQLKNDPLTADIPVIMVTARHEITDIEQGFEAGAFDYVRKPYNPRELTARVRNAIELKRRGDSLRKWKDRTSRELTLAAALQKSLLSPRPFLNEQLRIHPAYESSTEVGGDFFDIVPLPDGRVAVYVGDVAGHGVGPAIVAAMLKASLAELLNTYAAHGPARICNELHARFLQQIDLPHLFATLFLAIVDLKKRHWRCLSCGHPTPIVAGGSMLSRRDFEKHGGMPIGLSIAPPTPYSVDDEVDVEAPEGAVVLFVTDGLLEALPADLSDAGGRKIVADILEEWIQDGQGSAAEFILRRMKEENFELQSDDCTAVAVEHIAASEIPVQESIMLSTDTLQLVASRVEAALQAAGWPEEVSWAVSLLLLEHGSNVIRHGEPPPASRFSVQLRLRHSACELLVRDGGRPWTYAAAAGPEPPADAENGRGLFMMRRIAMRIETCRDDEENVTVFTVRKDWKPAP